MTTTRPYCDGLARRDLLRIGAASTLADTLTLPQLLAAESRSNGTGVSLIIVFLEGGLSTIDTFDNKPDAPPEFRGDFGVIDTNVPGLQLCEHLPRTAQAAHLFSLVRSFTHTNSSHGHADHYMLTGYHPRAGFNVNVKPNNQFPAYGAIMTRQLGPRGGVPPYVCLPKMHDSAGAAYLGSSCAPFTVNADPNAPGFSVPDLAPPLVVGADRLERRVALMSDVDRFRRNGEAAANSRAAAVNEFQSKALDLMTSPAARRAFDIAAEPDEMRDRYGRTSLGQSCLMARRLVEAGVRCVTIDHTNWDTHYNNFHVLKTDLLPQLDAALPALLTDLQDRGLLEKTLVAVFGEFGRTPRVNKDAGRDHWGPANTIVLAGGGIQGGRVIGATNEHGEHPAADPYGPEDLAATIFRCVGIDGNEEFHTPEGRPVKIVNNGRVIPGLM